MKETIIIEDGKKIENGGKRITDLAVELVRVLSTHNEKHTLIIIFSFLTVIINLARIREVSKYQLKNLILGYLKQYEEVMPDVPELKDGKKRKLSEDELNYIMNEFFDKNPKWTPQQFEDKVDDLIDTYDILKK